MKKKISNLNPNTKLFLGDRYFIIDRKIFSFLRKKKLKNIKNIFIFFGSGNDKGILFKVLNKLKKTKYKLNVVLGEYSNNLSKIKREYSNYRNVNFFYKLKKQEIYKLIKNCDISIGSGGVNLLERTIIGLPSIVYSLSENQTTNIEYLYKKKMIWKFTENDLADLVNFIYKISFNYKDIDRVRVLNKFSNSYKNILFNSIDRFISE